MTIHHRPRRLRNSEAWRALVRETEVRPGQLIQPFFVEAGEDVRKSVASMPGVHRVSVDHLLDEVQPGAEGGIGGVILFGIPERKDATGSGAWDPDGPVPQAVRALKDAWPELIVWADVCLCEYTDHGHCGVLDGEGRVLNDPTLPLLARSAVAYTRAGADAVAPSDMMDGRVGAIRAALDDAGFAHAPIVSYAVKYASAFYGPFRDAADSAPAFGDRRTYQMDPANAREASVEARLDLAEGADVLMVKPAGPYLDVIRRIRGEVDVPLAAYQVSGEYSALKAAAERGWLDERAAALESLLAIRRAGADVILTYYATQVAAWLQDG